MAFNEGVILGPISLNLTGSANTSIGSTSNSGTVSIGNASLTALNMVGPTNINVAGTLNTAIGSTSNTGTVAIGNTNSTSVTVIGPVNINTSSSNNTAIGSTSNTGTISIGNTLSGVITIDCGTAGINIGTTANAHATTVGSTTASATTTIQAPSAGMKLLGVQGVAVSNKNYVTINTATGALGSDAGPASGMITAAGDTGTATGSTITWNANTNAGSTVKFSASGSTVSLLVTDGVLTNTFIGKSTGNGSVTGISNTGVGYNIMPSITTGSENTFFGRQAGLAISSGSQNTGIGYQSLDNMVTGSYNAALGWQAGQQLGGGGSDSNNIMLNAAGTTGDNNTLRIGAGTGSGNQQLNKAFISGINGVTSSNPLMVTINSSTDQLGVAAIPSGIVTLNGDSGSATGSTVTIEGNGNASAGATVVFTGSGATLTLGMTDANFNTLVGRNSGNGSYTGSRNTGFGYNTLVGLTSGVQNTFVGWCGDSITSGSENTGVGYQALSNMVIGNYNVALGWLAGQQLGGGASDSSNIMINAPGTSGDNNTLRIGAGSGSGNQQLNKAFISGIAGVTVANSAAVLIDTVTDQLGTVASSARYKDNIRDMEPNAILNLRPVNFTYKEDKTSQKQYGLIAEEVAQIMPELVVYDKEGLPQSVKYHELPAILLNEIIKLRKELNALQRSR